MISLVIEDYCQDCPEFDPAIGRDNKCEFTSDGQVVSERYERTVECSHRRRCANMANYIRKEVSKIYDD